MNFINISCLITVYGDDPNDSRSPLYVEPIEGVEDFYDWDDWKNHYRLNADDLIYKIEYVLTGKERMEEIQYFFDYRG